MKTIIKYPSDAMVLRLWRETLIKQRGNKCQYPMCAVTKLINAHHLVDKQFFPFRYDLDNGFLLCVLHHKYGVMSAHKDPFFISDMITEHILTQGIIDKLFWGLKSSPNVGKDKESRLKAYEYLKSI